MPHRRKEGTNKEDIIQESKTSLVRRSPHTDDIYERLPEDDTQKKENKHQQLEK